jgi:hypothetical protein
MDIYINTSTGLLVQSATNRQNVSSLRFKRGDSSNIRVFFLDGVSTTPVELPSGTTGKFGLKETGKYDDGFVVSDLSWVLEDSDPDNIHYVFSPNFNTTQLNDLLGVGAGEDVASVTLMGEIEWVTAGAISSSVTFKAVVDNDVIRGTEGVPTDADPAYPLPNAIELKANKGVANGYAALDASGKVPLAQLPDLSGSTYDVGNVSGNVALNRANGEKQKAAATGNITIQVPTGGSEDDLIRLKILASGANRNLSFHANIEIPSDSGISLPKTLTAGKTYRLILAKGSTKWALVSLVGGVTD